jgi:hypothetical protein
MDQWHKDNGIDMIEVGLWMRPWFYRSSGSDVNAAYGAEMKTVRSAAGAGKKLAQNILYCLCHGVNDRIGFGRRKA